MKRFLLTAGLIAALAVTGCSQSEAEGDTATTDQASENKENTTENQETDEKAVKSGLLNAQLDFTNEIRPHHTKIATYQSMLISEEEISSENLKQAATDAKTAAGEAITLLEDYKVKSELPDDVKERYTGALASLSEYYTEVQSALEAAPEKADLSKAQEKFDQFQKNLSSIYKEAGLLSPDMKAELS